MGTSSYQRRRQAGALIGAFLSLITLSAAGCGSSLIIQNDQLPLLAAYQNKGSFEISYGSKGRSTVVVPSRQPRLELRGPEPALESFTDASGVHLTGAALSDLILTAPLERYRFEASRVILLAAGPPGQEGPLAARYRQPDGDYEIPLAAIGRAELMLPLRGPAPPEPREPRWGFGVSIAGPGRFVTVNVELRISRYFALDGGAFSFGPAFLGWLGAKAISPRLGPVALFGGGFVGALIAGEDDKGRLGTVTDRGVRLGFDIMLPEWSDAIELEFDLLWQRSNSPDDPFEGCPEGRACPFAGASYVHFF